ncbi:phasin family protein [Halomonas aestuarii]|uniref:Phasin family protein n=1 Tax=Halomonas aestuarii TaxID=1897729 RepID=A0A1J0VE10_9GAMM|nr:phasin family protein [Halomonas aestuarii]APE30265.1 phasin family protein [Halomonas aestuarii]
MSKATTQQATEQFESAFVAPARSVGALNLDYTEKLVAAQFDAVRALTDMGLSQARSWLDVRDADSLKKVVESQQKASQDMGERLRGDAEKIMSLGQEYVQQSQKIAEDGIKAATSAAK